MNDVVNHPAHYQMGNGVEVIAITEQLNFCRGNAVKYLCRAGHKDANKEIEDLEKAVWYTQREIQRLRGMNQRGEIIERLNHLCRGQEWCDTCPAKKCKLCRYDWQTLTTDNLNEILMCFDKAEEDA